jgi:hypothetical protein
VTDKRPLTPENISAIVRGLDPIDWVQVELLAKLPPGQRYIPALQAAEKVRAELRDKFTKEFPELSMPEINMKVLEYLTPVRMVRMERKPKQDTESPLPSGRVPVRVDGQGEGCRADGGREDGEN